jgi:hypothetical protein
MVHSIIFHDFFEFCTVKIPRMTDKFFFLKFDGRSVTGDNKYIGMWTINLNKV